MFAVGPEFDCIRTHTKPGPERRARNFAAPKLPSEPRDPREKLRARAKSSALMRRGRGKLALSRAGGPIRVGLGRGNFLYASFDADLPAHRLPVECERPMWIAAQLTPLAASGVGEKHEAALVDYLEQDEADGALPAARHRRKRHRLIVRNSCAPRVLEPADEFRNRVVAVPCHGRNHAMPACSTAINR